MGKKIVVNDRDYHEVMGKDHVAELRQKALDAWEKQKNYSLAEFYLKAALKERPDSEELQAKLIEVGFLARKQREEEAARQLTQKARSPRPRAETPPPPAAPAAKSTIEEEAGAPARATDTSASPDEDEVSLLGVQVKGVNTRKVAVLIAAGAVLLISLFAYRMLRRDAGEVDLELLKSISGITFQEARVVNGILEGVVDKSWFLLEPGEKEKKVAVLFAAYSAREDITGLVLSDHRQQRVAEVRPDGIRIFQ